MAESSKPRGGNDTPSEDPDEVLSEAVDGAPDDSDLKSVASREKSAKSGSKDKTPGIFARFFRFVREIVAELQKVIWPTRKELITYTSVVVVFVAVMLSIVGMLDLGFAKLMLLIFGESS